MPRGDGTGPPQGSGPRTGRGGKGTGRMRGTRPGPGGECVCPSCGARASHQVGIPCYDVACPKCGTKMMRG